MTLSRSDLGKGDPNWGVLGYVLHHPFLSPVRDTGTRSGGLRQTSKRIKTVVAKGHNHSRSAAAIVAVLDVKQESSQPLAVDRLPERHAHKTQAERKLERHPTSTRKATVPGRLTVEPDVTNTVPCRMFGPLTPGVIFQRTDFASLEGSRDTLQVRRLAFFCSLAPTEDLRGTARPHDGSREATPFSGLGTSARVHSWQLESDLRSGGRLPGSPGADH